MFINRIVSQYIQTTGIGISNSYHILSPNIIKRLRTSYIIIEGRYLAFFLYTNKAHCEYFDAIFLVKFPRQRVHIGTQLILILTVELRWIENGYPYGQDLFQTFLTITIERGQFLKFHSTLPKYYISLTLVAVIVEYGKLNFKSYNCYLLLFEIEYH